MRTDGIISIVIVGMAMTMPWFPWILPILLVLLLVAVLFSARVRNTPFDASSPLPWMAMLYLWHVVGMFWSTDAGFGWMDLGIKLSMLLVPFIVWWRKGNAPFEKEQVLRWFVVGCVAFTGWLVLRSSALFGLEYALRLMGTPIEGAPYWNHLFSSYFSWYVHPTYLAYYLVIALGAWTLTDLHDKAKPWRSTLVLLVLVLGVVLCSSKMGWIALALLGPYILVVRWSHQRLRRTLLISALVGVGVFAALYVSVGGVRGKVTEAITAVGAGNDEAEDSSSARRSVWASAVDLITEAPLLGQGTGDVKNELVARYQRNGSTFAFEHRLNAHSQFVQTQVALGVVGSLLLVSGLLVPLLFAVRRRHHLMIVLLLCTILNWSVESMLEVQAGVMSFMFFAMLLTWKSRPDNGRDRIVLLTQYYPPETGAPQNRLHAMAKQLVAHGAEVTVLTAMPNYPDMRIQADYRGRLYKREEMDGVIVHRAWLLVSSKRSLFWRLCNYFSFVFTSYLMGLLVLGRTRLLMVESPPLFLGLSAVGLARAKGAKLVFNVSDLWPESAVQLGLVTAPWMIKTSAALEMWCYENAELITGQTMGIVRDIQHRCPKKPVVWIPNGVDLDLMDRIEPADRQRFGISPEAVVFAYAGIIGHAQGLEVVIKAANLVDDRRILFLLIGDGPERAGLQALALAMELGNVRFIDPMPRAEVLSLVATCDGAVVPLRANPLFKGAIPSKIFEALALERPVILGVDGEARDLFIREGGGGMYVEPEDPHALAAAAMRLAQDPAERKHLGAAGARYVRAAFDRQRIGDRLWKAMNEISNSDLRTP